MYLILRKLQIHSFERVIQKSNEYYEMKSKQIFISY
jgi:hypothetical protein